MITMFDPILIALALFAAVAVAVTIAIIRKMDNYVNEERTSTVKRKWAEKDVVMIWNGVEFVNTLVTNHYFEMDNGDVVRVSEELCEGQALGSSYTYIKQVKKPKNVGTAPAHVLT